MRTLHNCTNYRQLEDLRRKKEAKERRNRARAEGRRCFHASSRIQDAFRSFLRAKRDKHIDIITSFLKTSTNKQAVAAAAWAIRYSLFFTFSANLPYNRCVHFILIQPRSVEFCQDSSLMH